MKKKLFLSVTFCCILVASNCFSQTTWIQKANFGGTGRYFPISFSIGNKGYLGTGSSSSGQTSDFWEYNPAADSWIKKANFAAGNTTQGVSFSIGLKGYVIPGSSNQLWEYDPSTDIWTRKADFGGPGQYNAVGFSIGNKGYIGAIGVNYKSPEFWEYNPANDVWTRKADYGGGITTFAVGFSIGAKGYMGTGQVTVAMDSLGTTNDTTKGNDFWEYDPATNAWTQKADVGGGARFQATGFSIGNKGYIGTGKSGSEDFWEYNPANDSWTRIADIGNGGTTTATGFSIGNKGYVGCGQDATGYSRVLWEWTALPFSISSVNVSCNGNNDGTASVTIIGSAAPYTYSWSNGATTNSISGLSPGTYTVTVTDNTGYAPFATITISQPQILSISYSSNNSTCGGNTGTANVTVNGGTIPYNYSWSNGRTTQNISGIGGGSYSVTVTDKNGCTISDNVSISNSITLGSNPICMVTTDSASNYNYNVITWDKTLYNNVDSFIVYRKDAITLNYLKIGSVSKDSLSQFTDTQFSIGGPNGGNPQYSSWLYKLAILDTCGNISAKSPYHQSLFVQRSGSNFSWNAYTVETGQTNPLTGYSFLRDDNNTGNWHVLINTLGLSTTDPNYASFPNGNWRIDALGFNCTPTRNTYLKSHSNTTKQAVTGIKQLALNNEQIIIYPNPSNGNFIINVKEEFSSIEIRNLLGEKVYTSSLSIGQSTIDISDQSKGIYFITVQSKDGIATKKLILN